jgi:hypothetical protein
VTQEYDAGSFSRDVVGSAHRNAYMRRCQGGRIVQSIAHHGDFVAMSAGVAIVLQLFFGQQAGHDIAESHFARNSFGGALAVAGEHGEVRDFQMLELMHCAARAFANAIAKQETARQDIVLGH